MEDQFLYGQQHAYDAEVQYQNEIFGLKLALSYVREYIPSSLAQATIASSEQSGWPMELGSESNAKYTDHRHHAGIFSIIVEASLVFFL